MTQSRSLWLQYARQDLQATPGRLNSSLRITLTTVVVLVAMMVLQIPFVAYGLYTILVVSHENPSVSVRLGIASLFSVCCALSIALAVVIMTDNDPMARIISLAAITFVAGMITVASTLPASGPIFGLIFGVGIGFWENHAQADTLVKNSLWFLAAFASAIAGSIAVGYVFALRSPGERLAEQLRTRYRTLATMFEAYGSDSTDQQRWMAAERVSRLAAAGQRGMLELYAQVGDVDVQRSGLPIGVQIHIVLVAELLDTSAAFGLQAHSSDLKVRFRCKVIAQKCAQLAREFKVNPELEPKSREPVEVTHLDRIESILHSLQTISLASDDIGPSSGALRSKQTRLLIPGAIWKMDNVAFALKISLCATICYILYHAVDWPGISTAVITVMVAGLANTGAMKQRLALRVFGAIAGGLVLGLGAEVFLFPFMDSITSLIVVIGTVAFLCAWIGGGPRFGYVGLQIAFAFYLTSLEGFHAPTELAPARDRFVGILLAAIIMWFVLDQLWPLRTITAMRRAVAAVLKDASRVVSLTDSELPRGEYVRESDNLRDRLGSQLSTVRMLNEATAYEFGVDREKQMSAGGTLMQISMAAVALVWNHAELIHSKEEDTSLSSPALVSLRQAVAQRLTSIADAIAEKRSLDKKDVVNNDLELTAADSDSEYSRNTIAKFNELQRLALSFAPTD